MLSTMDRATRAIAQADMSLARTYAAAGLRQARDGVLPAMRRDDAGWWIQQHRSYHRRCQALGWASRVDSWAHGA
jgi:hypothetical protein